MNKVKGLGVGTKYLPDVHLSLIAEMASQGFTDKQIAQRIGVTERTLHNWKRASGELMEGLATSKLMADDRVELSLFDRALGYPYEEVVMEPNAAGVMVVTRVVRKQALPDVTAQIFWLKNRRPERWRDRYEGELFFRDYKVIPAQDTVTAEVIKGD